MEVNMDLKLQTFLMVVEMGSYTKAAKKLHITQPAVTQHIQWLEEYYGSPLLHFKNRRLGLTLEGEEILRYAKDLKAMETVLFQKLDDLKRGKKEMRFASTLTIGEFTMEPILEKLFHEFLDYDVKMRVDNTENILLKLKEGKISFALIEGLFNGEEFETRELKTCDFILVAKRGHALAIMKQVFIRDLLGERLIIREKGSGSREILEMGLKEKNQSLESFNNIMELGNVNLMKSMVEKGIGISLMYRDAALKELKQGTLVEVPIEDLKMTRGFYFVRLKSIKINEDQERIFDFLKEQMDEKALKDK